MFAKNLTLNSISDFKKQLDALNSHSKFNTGYLNEYQNNTLGNTPEWSKKNLHILQHGAGGGTASYLFNKVKWEKQLKKSLQLQSNNLEKTNHEIAKIQHDMQKQGCK